MYKHLKSVLTSHTVRQTFITSFSTFAAAGLGAVFYLLLARNMSVKDFGLFSLGLSVLLTGSSLTDLGMSPSIVRFVGANKDGNRYFPYANIAFRIKVITSLVSLLILTVFSQQIAIGLFNQPDLAPFLPLVGLGIACMVMFSLSASVLQGLQEYVWWGGIQVGANLIRLIVLSSCIFLGLVTPTTALLMFGGTLFAGFAISWFKLNKKILLTKPLTSQIREFWGYNKWTAVFTIVAASVSRLDTFMVARYVQIEQVGIYSLALTMVSFLPQLSSAIGAVTGPKFAGFTDNTQSHHYFKKALLFSSGVSVLTALAMIPASLFVIWYTGKNYDGAFTPFLVLLAGIAVFSASGPLRDSILYAHKKPQFFVWAGLVQGLVVMGVCGLLIPSIGILGASWSILASHVVLLFLCFLYYRRLQRP